MCIKDKCGSAQDFCAVHDFQLSQEKYYDIFIPKYFNTEILWCRNLKID